MKLHHLKNFFENVKTTEELNAQLKNILLNYKIKTFAFTYYAYHPQSKNKLKYDYCSSNFEIWHKHYLSEGYENVDSTLDAVYQTTLPVFWDLAQQLKEAKSPREKQMRQDGLNFGAEKGLSIPIHGPNDDFAVFLFVQMKNENCLEKWFEIQDELTLLAKCYYHYLQKIMVRNALDSSLNKFQLTKRELQCILLTAKKRSVSDIAEALQIKERTVNFHLQSANKKLGVQNKYQSVAKAIAKGIIVL